jgi:hypothetical protein
MIDLCTAAPISEMTISGILIAVKTIAAEFIPNTSIPSTGPKHKAIANICSGPQYRDDTAIFAPSIGRPHCGHDIALGDTPLSQSGHWYNPTVLPPT